MLVLFLTLNFQPVRVLVLFFTLVLIACACSRNNSSDESGNQNKFPRALPTKSFTDCYNGAGFFRVNKDNLTARLPKDFVARDGGEILGEQFKGYGYLVLIYFACPLGNDSTMQLAVIATPIQEPTFANDMRTVRWNWYEFGRIVATSNQAKDLNALGFSAQYAILSNTAFHEGDTITSFEAKVDDNILLRVEMSLTDSVNFQAQSHRLWHQRSDGRLVSTRWDFEYHHSWTGKFENCSFNSDILSVADLKGLECSGEGITEAIERISFSENLMVWR